MTYTAEDTVKEILKAIKMAIGPKSKDLNQAAIQSALSKIAWKHIEPISVGDDYSLVF